MTDSEKSVKKIKLEGSFLSLTALRKCTLACFILLLPLPPVMVLAQSMVIDANVAIAMRDGTEISVDIYRPAKEGRYPTLYAAAPYPHHWHQNAPHTKGTGPVAWYVEQGYAYVLASTRGSGQSDGDFEFLSRNEQQDHYEVVEWIAAQDWSNGKVAGVGNGYYGTSQWLLGIQNPPHLACIAPFNGVLDAYRDWAYPGGVDSRFSIDWFDREVLLANLYPPQGENGRLIPYNLRYQQLSHPLDDAFWRLRSPIENLALIKVPVFILGTWSEASPSVDSAFKALSRLDVTKRMLILRREAADTGYANEEFHARYLLPFYEWCLKHPDDTSFIELPRIRYAVEGEEGDPQPASIWPPRGVEYKPLTLSKTPASQQGGSPGTLSFSPEAGPVAFSSYGSPGDTDRLTFISAPLDRDQEIAGPMILELHASSSSRDTAFKIQVSEQVVYSMFQENQPNLPSFLDPDSVTTPLPELLTATSIMAVTSGQLKASVRELDANLSSDFDPVYHLDRQNPLTPGRVYQFRIRLGSLAYRFRKGNRIVLEISRAQDASLPAPGRESVYHSSQFPSRLWLPLLPGVTAEGNSTATPQTPAANTSRGKAFDPYASPILYLNPGLGEAEQDTEGLENE